MARKQKIAPSFAPITTEIANAIIAAIDDYAFDVAVECEPASVDMTDDDHIFVKAEGVVIRIAVGTGEIPYPGNPIPTNNYGKVLVNGYIAQAPGVNCTEKAWLNGSLELDYSKPEAKINGTLFLDILDKAIKIKKKIEDAFAEEIC